ncbi:hypothetical protein [Gemella cuniculi]|uniref:hypothetical protein n=1 Tax=Gemella cuniculi TaxID=150240 RepID=UPI00041EF1EB|nr:hypothetical protein [Gemella cuniculi]
MKAVNQLIKRKKTIIKEGQELIDLALDTTELEKRKSKSEDELNEIVDTINYLISENSKKTQNQKEYEEKYQEAVAEYEKVQEELTNLTQNILDKEVRRDEVASFLKTIKEQEAITKFDVDLWCNTIDCIIVKNKQDFIVKFQDGTEENVGK